MIYNLDDQEGDLLSLRYDQTVPFSRYMATHNLTHMTRYQIGTVYRRDNPSLKQKRFREFYQCDFDIAGNYDLMMADVECLDTLVSVFKSLDIGTFKVKVNHRKLIDGIFNLLHIEESKWRMVCSSIDKLDKMSWKDVRNELINEKDIDEKIVDRMEPYFTSIEGVDIGKCLEKLSKLVCSEGAFLNTQLLEAVKELQKLDLYLSALDARDCISFDSSLARGLDYYTGMIMEVVLVDNPYGLGSIAGGGRYNDLIGMFSKNQIPSVGFAIGIERIFEIYMEKRKQEQRLHTNTIKVLVAGAGKTSTSVMRYTLSKFLRDGGIPCQILMKESPSMKEQIEFAIGNQIPYMAVVGENEFKDRKLNLKIVETKDEIKGITWEDAVVYLKSN